MPYDPTLPAHASPDSSAEMRAQFTGLFDLIQSIPVGPPGPPGASVTAAVIDGVSTVDPASGAVTTFFDGTTVHFTFALPRGNDGSQGPQGNNGVDGATGPQGPMFTNFVIDGVTTLAAGEPAAVTTSFDGTNIRFAFAIPRGPAGPEDLSGTAMNPSITNLDLVASDPPTQGELQQVIDKLNELMNALRRAGP